jgi:hypothetical protein
MTSVAITTATAGALAAAARGLAGAAAAAPTATSALCWLRPRHARSPVVLSCKSFGPASKSVWQFSPSPPLTPDPRVHRVSPIQLAAAPRHAILAAERHQDQCPAGRAIPLAVAIETRTRCFAPCRWRCGSRRIGSATGAMSWKEEKSHGQCI